MADGGLVAVQMTPEEMDWMLKVLGRELRRIDSSKQHMLRKFREEADVRTVDRRREMVGRIYGKIAKRLPQEADKR